MPSSSFIFRIFRIVEKGAAADTEKLLEGII